MPFSIIVTVRDGKGKESTTKVNIPSSTDWVDVVEFAEGIATTINTLITGSIVRVGVAFEVDISSLGFGAPDPASDVEEGALFIFNTTTGFSTRMRIPTFDETKIVTGTQAVDVADGAVVNYVNAMTDGLTLTSTNLVQPCDSRGDDIADEGLKLAQEMFQSSRR